MHSFCCCNLLVGRNVSKKGSPPPWPFCIALDQFLSWSDRNTTTLVSENDFFIPTKFHQNPSSGSYEEVENVNSLTDGRTDGRTTGDHNRSLEPSAPVDLNTLMTLFAWRGSIIPAVPLYPLTVKRKPLFSSPTEKTSYLAYASTNERSTISIRSWQLRPVVNWWRLMFPEINSIHYVREFRTYFFLWNKNFELIFNHN